MIKKTDISKYSLGESRLSAPHSSKKLFFAKNLKDPMDSAIVVKNYFDQDEHFLISMRTKFAAIQERFNVSNNKNIVEIKYWDMVQAPQTRLYNLYFFMEKMKDNLFDIIKERKIMKMYFTEQEMKKLVGDTFGGMKAIQKNRIAHMNLKPSNILVDFDETYKIADIGHPNDMSLPQFIAPELSSLGNVSAYYEQNNNGREETFRADAFSYGAILFHSASLCDISEVEALKAVQTGAMKFVKEKFTDIGKRYGDTLAKIIKDLTSHNDRKNFIQIEDLIMLYLSSTNSQVLSESPIAQSQFVSQLISKQDEQTVLKDLLEEVYQQKDVNVRQELQNAELYGKKVVSVDYFEQIMNKALKGKLKRDELSLLAKYYDSGKGDNTIDYIKFCDNMEAPHKRQETTVQDLMKQFYQNFRMHCNTFEEFTKKYDQNRNGIFDFNEIRAIYKEWFQNFDSDSFNMLFKSLNPNKQNQIYFTNLEQAFQPFINEDLAQIIKQIADAFERSQSTFESFIQKSSVSEK